MGRALRIFLVAVWWAILTFLGWPSAGQQENKEWKAQWITAPSAAERDQVVLHFRKVLELANAPRQFVVHVSADNQFVLYVNKREAGRGPSRADLAHWRYETYDIARSLHAGKNVVAATVWHFGTEAAVAQMSERTGFLLQGAGDTERVADTNETWEVEEEKGVETIRPQVNGYYAAEPGLRIDGTKWDWDALTDNGREKTWSKAIGLGRGALREERNSPNSWQLVADPLPAMEMREVPAGKVVRANCEASSSELLREGMTLPARSKCNVLVDNGELTTGYPMLSVSGGRGAAIRLTYAEALIDDKGRKGNRNEIAGKHIEGVVDEYLPAGGGTAREFSPLAWRTWRYLQLETDTRDEPVRILGLRTWFSAYPFKEQAYFHADDASLDPIWKIGWRTARLDAHDTYMDTPYWERLQYVGDTRIQALISYVVAGDDRLGRQAIESFDASRVPDGLTQSRYPSSLEQMIPTFSLLWVGMVHDFWMYRGDSAFVSAQLPGIRSTLGWFLRRQRSDGLLANLSWWPFVDWGADFVDGVPPQEPHGQAAAMTLQFVEALRDAAELERALGDRQVASQYQDAAVKAADGVKTLCWNERYGLLADTPAQKHFSQHTNILGIWLDVIPPKSQKEVMEKILSTSDKGFASRGEVPAMTTATYYFRFYLARALEHAGMGDEYLKLLGPWRQMVGMGLTTWAESPEPTRSDSHAWSAHPNFDLLRIVAGIRPGAPGFSKVEIEPHLGALKDLKAAMPIPQGTVELQYRKAPGGTIAKVNLPGGISGELVWNGGKSPLKPGAQTVDLR
jgi:hypothetical protein